MAKPPFKAQGVPEGHENPSAPEAIPPKGKVKRARRKAKRKGPPLTTAYSGGDKFKDY
jgi:hypothetical protein